MCCPIPAIFSALYSLYKIKKMVLTENYFQARRNAIAWLNSKRDFETGVNLLIASGYKPIVAAKIKRWGDIPHSREKLVYEIRQMIQVWGAPDDPKHEDVDFEEEATSGTGEAVTESETHALLAEADEEKHKEDDENQHPLVIRKIIYEFSDCYKSRSVLHKQLGELPEDNAGATVQKRKVIVQSIAALSARMKVLYELRKRYDESGVLPTQEELEGYHDAEEDQNKEDDSGEEPVQLPDNPDELKKLRKNEATKLTRARNMLLYQAETKPKPLVENPMPDCPKRIKMEKKVAYLEELIKRIDYKIAQLS